MPRGCATLDALETKQITRRGRALTGLSGLSGLSQHRLSTLWGKDRVISGKHFAQESCLCTNHGFTPTPRENCRAYYGQPPAPDASRVPSVPPPWDSVFYPRHDPCNATDARQPSPLTHDSRAKLAAELKMEAMQARTRISYFHLPGRLRVSPSDITRDCPPSLLILRGITLPPFKYHKGMPSLPFNITRDCPSSFHARGARKVEVGNTRFHFVHPKAAVLSASDHYETCSHSTPHDPESPRVSLAAVDLRARTLSISQSLCLSLSVSLSPCLSISLSLCLSCLSLPPCISAYPPLYWRVSLSSALAAPFF